MQRESERAVVWVDRWQFACCGAPFGLGGPVTWSLRTDVDRQFLSRAATPGLAASIDYREEHHDGSDAAPGAARDAVGIVRGIRALRCAYTMDEVEGASVPLPGSGSLVPVGGSSDDLSPGDERIHLGWVVDLEILDLGERRLMPRG